MAVPEEPPTAKKRPKPKALMEMKHELSLPAQSWWGTEQRWLQERDEEEEERLFQSQRRQWLRVHLLLFVGVAGFLILWSLFPGGVPSWVALGLLAWGVAVIVHIWAAGKNHGEEYERAFQRWRFHRQMTHKQSGKRS
jgi:hypothetical protein